MDDEMMLEALLAMAITASGGSGSQMGQPATAGAGAMSASPSGAGSYVDPFGTPHPGVSPILPAPTNGQMGIGQGVNAGPATMGMGGTNMGATSAMMSPYAATPLPGGDGSAMNMGLSGRDQLLQDLMLASQLGGGDPNAPLFGIPQNRQVDPLTSGGTALNETLLANLIYDNPQLAISLGGGPQYGTPGYWNLAGMQFDPWSIYAAAGNNMLSGPVDYTQFAANLYNAMGTVANQGGGTVDAGTLLTNMVTAPPDSDLGKIFSENPEQFYTMALDVATAAGMSPLGKQALQIQLAGLFNEWSQVALTSNAGDYPAFHTWIATAHPEIVEAWRS